MFLFITRKQVVLLGCMVAVLLHVSTPIVMAAPMPASDEKTGTRSVSRGETFIDYVQKLTLEEKRREYELLNTRIAAGTRDGELYFRKGELELEFKSPYSALQSFQAAVDNGKRDFEGYYGLARCHESLKRYDESQNHYNEAVFWFKKALRRNRHDLDTLYRLANLQYLLGFNEDASENLRTIKELNLARDKGTQFEVILRLGEAYQALHKYNEAIQEYLSAKLLDDESPLPDHRIGETYRMKGDYDLAVHFFNQSLKKDPSFWKCEADLKSTLKVMMNRKAYVKKIQLMLKALDYYNGPIDGIFGTLTESAIIAFKYKYMYSEDLQVGATRKVTSEVDNYTYQLLKKKIQDVFLLGSYEEDYSGLSFEYPRHNQFIGEKWTKLTVSYRGTHEIDDVVIRRGRRRLKQEVNVLFDKSKTRFDIEGTVFLDPGENNIDVTVKYVERGRPDLKRGITVYHEVVRERLGVGRKYAVVIGVQDYPYSDVHLDYARRNAEKFATYLDIYRGYDPEDIFLITDSRNENDPVVGEYQWQLATRAGVWKVLNDLKGRLKREDVLVIYFNGHGGVEETRDRRRLETYLMPHDYGSEGTSGLDGDAAESGEPPVASSLSRPAHDRKVILLYNLLTYIAEARAQRVFLILDACQGGPKGTDVVLQSVEYTHLLGSEDRIEPEDDTMEEMDMGKAVFWSNEGLKPSYEEKEDNMGSVFSYYLMEYIKQNYLNRRKMNLSTLSTYLNSNVERHTRSKVHPQHPKVSLITGDSPNLMF